jgi:hypothetical protein
MGYPPRKENNHAESKRFGLELVSAAVTPIGSTFGEAAFLALAENG